MIYNVVPWSYLSPQLLVRILREVPGVIGVKQSAGDLKLLADLLLSAPVGKRIFSAVDALLYPSFALGAHGSIAAILTAAPHACVQLWDAVQAGNHERALDLHRRLLPLWNALVANNLPACTKYAQTLQNVPAGHPSAPMPPPRRPSNARSRRRSASWSERRSRDALDQHSLDICSRDAIIVLAQWRAAMASVLVRDLDPTVVERLKVRAEEILPVATEGAEGDPRHRGSAGDLGGSRACMSASGRFAGAVLGSPTDRRSAIV